MNLQGFLLLQTGFCSAARCEAAGFPVAADSFLLHSQEWNCSFAVRLEGGCHWPKTAAAVVDFLLRMFATSFSNSQGNIAQKKPQLRGQHIRKNAQESPQLRGQHITKKSTTKSTKKHTTPRTTYHKKKSTRKPTTPRTTYHKKKHNQKHKKKTQLRGQHITKKAQENPQLRGQHITKKAQPKAQKKHNSEDNIAQKKSTTKSTKKNTTAGSGCTAQGKL